MASYEQFAMIYDSALNELPYGAWLVYIESIFKKNGLEPNLILDLGCGTGSMTNLMAKKGYEMIGVDLSEDMLAIARDKAKEEELEGVMYLNQDMTELDLFGTVDAVISVGDALNYITFEEDLKKTFEKVNLFLNPGGLFIFDMNTVYKFKEVLGNKTYAENHEDYAYIWENYYYEDEAINEYEVNVFIKNEDGLYEKSTEVHHERGYEPKEVIKCLEASGLKFLALYHDNTFEDLKSTTQRMYFVAQEVMKEK
ncbi:class I SAM-dependent DNA methyltransferase [Petrocella sp. FN5]|uniref:class I SAM-dependent DNA methyltransferase n=1 Tax=Petrocella sp. FN5 TaxID=3032002 RepID=UPI002ECFCD99